MINIKIISKISHEVLYRAELQYFLSKKLKCFPKIKIKISGGNLIQETQYIPSKPLPNNNSIKNLLDIFQNDIHFMHSVNYIHGDILKKNIIYDGKIFRLIDHELKLLQNNFLISTYPWISLDDLKLKTITKKTDEICLYATKLRLLEKNKYIVYRNERVKLLSEFGIKIKIK